MNLKQLASTAKFKAKTNSPTIFSVLAAAGVVGTAYLSGKASWLSAEQVMLEEEQAGHMDAKDRARMVWKNYIPTAVSGAATVACLIGANRAGAKKTAAAQAAVILGQKAFEEYREKVAETIGAGQEQKVTDAVKQDQVTKNPPPSSMVVTGNQVLCQESYTGRYFTSDMQTLRSAENEINRSMFTGVYSTLNDFYYLVGLEPTSESSNMGWEIERPLELSFSTALANGNVPVIVVDYNYISIL